MSRRIGPVVVAALLAVAAGVPSRTLAQDAGVPAVASATPPRLLEHVPAEHPPGLEDRDAAVLLQITVGADGAVIDVEVVEGAGDGFDERAVEAARAFRFEPARSGDQAIAARIRYRYAFEGRRFETVEEPEPTEADAGADDEAEADAHADAGAQADAQADAGTQADADADDRADADDEAEADAAAQAEADVAPVFRARAAVEPPPRDTIRRTLRREVLTRMPGTRGDALRVVELLPGVGRPAFGGGTLLVRGSAPGDSQVFLDGNPVPLLYHFGGLTSFYNSQLLNRIDFVPGNFSVRYGRKIGGILEVEPRDPRFDGYHGFLDISGGIDASLMFEGPIDRHFAFAVALRRSYIDAIFGAVQGNLGEDAPQFLTAPVYWDYQAIATWTPTTADRIRLLIYGSSDELRLLLRNPSDSDFAVRGNLGFQTQFHRLQVSWRHAEDDWEQDISVGFGLDFTEFGLGEALSIDSRFYPLNFRSEWRVQLAPDVRTIFGIDTQITPLTLDFRGPQPTQSEGMPASRMLGESSVDYSTGDVVALRPAAYVETDVTLWDALDLALGVRADWYREIDELTVDPRLTARLRLTQNVALRTGVGLFSQPPEFQESAEGLGNPELEPIHALHVGLGGDLRLPDEGFSVSLDGFYKHLYDRVVATPRSLPPFFTNDGIGRIYGLEVAARLEPDGPLPVFGFLSYTFSRSERQDGPGQEWRLFDFDQTHILTLSLVWRIGAGWEAGATFRLVSGNPMTPVTGAIQDVRTGTYRPLYGAINSDRNPFFHRLDVRVQKLWRIGSDFRLTFYIDIQNVYNSTNREGLIYNYDYSQTQELPGLPIIPSLGLRGEL